MKTCYIVIRWYRPLDEFVGVTATFEEAEELRLLIAKKDISDYYNSRSLKAYNATEEEYQEYAEKLYSIHEVNFYSKLFSIEEL